MSSTDIPTDSSVATGETSANVSSAPQPPHKRRLLIIVSVVVIVLAAAGGSGYYFWHKGQHKTASAPPAAAEQSAANTAIQQANNGNSGQALSTLNTAINNTTDKSQKSTLYQQQGVINENAQNYKAAETSYQNAAQNGGLTYGLAQSIAETAVEEGNNQLAIQYYQKAIDLIPTNDPTAQAEKQSYQTIISNLQSGSK